MRPCKERGNVPTRTLITFSKKQQWNIHWLLCSLTKLMIKSSLICPTFPKASVYRDIDIILPLWAKDDCPCFCTEINDWFVHSQGASKRELVTLGCHFLGNRQERGAAGLAAGKWRGSWSSCSLWGSPVLSREVRRPGLGPFPRTLTGLIFCHHFKNIYIQKVKNRRIGEYVGEKRKNPKGVNGSCSVA